MMDLKIFNNDCHIFMFSLSAIRAGRVALKIRRFDVKPQLKQYCFSIFIVVDSVGESRSKVLGVRSVR
jgi:hypothetical protein